jgi:hypothetical protein
MKLKQSAYQGLIIGLCQPNFDHLAQKILAALTGSPDRHPRARLVDLITYANNSDMNFIKTVLIRLRSVTLASAIDAHACPPRKDSWPLETIVSGIAAMLVT